MDTQLNDQETVLIKSALEALASIHPFVTGTCDSVRQKIETNGRLTEWERGWLALAIQKECVSHAPLVWPVAKSIIKKMDLEELVKQCFCAWGGKPWLPWITALSKDQEDEMLQRALDALDHLFPWSSQIIHATRHKIETGGPLLGEEKECLALALFFHRMDADPPLTDWVDAIVEKFGLGDQIQAWQADWDRLCNSP